MHDRLDLHSTLCEILGSNHVYFQPPESMKMVYPAIRYSLNTIYAESANDKPYIKRPSYTITFISKDPDSDTVQKIADLPTARHNRHYTAENLNHDVFTIYL